jgi:predicted CoA-binding protein
MIQQEKIVVLGASQNPARTSYMATRYLHNRGFSLFAIANRKGMIENIELHDDSELATPIEADTITVFLQPERQKKYYAYILSLKPRRIIFNPGTENPELEQLACRNNIQVLTGCTIAMLAGGLL